MVVGSWYSAVYKEEFRITFQVLALEGKTMSLCREDGAIVDSLPSGYLSLIHHGDNQPLCNDNNNSLT